MFGRDLHLLLTLATLAAIVVVIGEAAVRLVRGRPPGRLAARNLAVVLILVAMASAGGLALLVGGHRPREWWHVMYAGPCACRKCHPPALGAVTALVPGHGRLDCITLPDRCRALRDDAASCCFDWPTSASRTCSRSCVCCRAAITTRTPKSLCCATRSPCYSVSSATGASDSRSPTGRCSPRYYAHSPTQRCSDHACWSARTRSRAGTATCSPAATLPPADPTGATDHKRCVPSAPWSCAWPGRTAAGATGAGTANS